MSGRYVIGIDHGSGGCKVTCLERSGSIVAEAYVPYPSHYERPRWVEQEPERWIEAAVEGIRKALRGFSPKQRAEVAAIGFSAPHHVAVLLDRDRRVIRRAIMWNDQRSDEESNHLIEHYGDRIYRIARNRPAPTWTLSQMLWLSRHEPEVYGRIDRIVFMKDYVRYRFCGELATDYIDAGGTLFFDIPGRKWSDELLSLISLDKSVLPELKKPTDVHGGLLSDMAERLGLPAGIPVVVGTADTAAEIYGAGAVEIGDGVFKLATAGNYTLVSGQLPENGGIITYEHVVDGLYYLNCVTNFAASSFRWFKESFYPEAERTVPADRIYDHINREIERVPPGSEGLLFHPYLNGERAPYWDPYLRASFFGITARHGRGHFARAVMEGVALSLRDAGTGFGETARKPLRIIGGGSKSAVWRQIVADVLDRELEVPRHSDASFGVCLLTATAIGWYGDVKEAVRSVQSIAATVVPVREHVRLYNELFDLYTEVTRNTAHISHRLARL